MKLYYEKAVRRYLMLSTVLECALVLIWIISCIWIRGFVAILLLSVLLIVSKIAISIVAKKTLLTVLVDELDAEKFQKMVDDNHFKAPLLYRISAAVSSGDYQTVVNIATKVLSNKKANIKVKYYYLSVLSRAYFELRDFEKLKLLVTKYNEYCSKFPIKKDLFPIWDYYKSFLNLDYNRCKSFCNLKNAQLKNSAWGSKLKKVQNDFLYAIACFENNELEQAKQVFLDIIQKAPKLYLSVLSKKYVAAIQGGKICFEEILPDSNYQFVENKKFKIIRLIKNISLVIVVAAALIVLEFIPGPKEISEYDKKLQTALSQQYTNFEVLAYMNVEENDVVKDVVVFVKDEKGEIDVGFIVSYDNGVSYDVKIMESNISYGTYVLKSFTGEHSIYLLISDYHINGNDSYSNSKFDCLGKKYFVHAKAVE